MATLRPDDDQTAMRELAEDTEWDAQRVRETNPGNKAVGDLAAGQAKLNQLMVKTFNRIDGQVQKLSDSVGVLRGGYARAEVEKSAGVIALDMGLGYVRTMSRYELAALAQSHSGSGFTKPELQSFRAADLVIQATDGPQIVYVAVEVSFTADKRDTDRALRNARMLREFMSCPTRAAIASVKNDDYVTEQVDRGLIHWHQIDERSLEPD